MQEHLESRKLLSALPVNTVGESAKFMYEGAVEHFSGLRKQSRIQNLIAIVPEMTHRLVLMSRSNSAYHTGIGRQAELQFWEKLGPDATDWLIDRLGEVHNLQQQWAIADVLGDIGSVSFKPIIRRLKGNTTDEQAEGLLSAIGNMPAAIVRDSQVEISELVQRHLSHRDSVVREKAVRASLSLSGPEAKTLLEAARANENDEDVRITIDDMLEQRSHG